MSYLSGLKTSSSIFLSLPYVPYINNSYKRFRKRMICDICLDAAPKRPMAPMTNAERQEKYKLKLKQNSEQYEEKKKRHRERRQRRQRRKIRDQYCFEMDNVCIERGGMCHAKLVRSFLYEHYWTRDPCNQGLWMSIDAPSLNLLTEKYAYTGDRFIALERIPRTGERRVIGVAVANNIYEWEPDELEDWAHATADPQERTRLYFVAHCYRGANLWKKYHSNYFYEIEVLVTAAEVTGQGVGTMLVKRAIDDALELRTKLIAVFSRGTYSNKICERLGMKKVWSVKYADFIDHSGVCLFFPRRPHSEVAVYVTELKC